ncbi:hypothetical protein GHNINEIG_00401 [Hydrogenovibrio crunogenus]|uniref:Uncharacterized protein n=1 Tax=Hydrogenovibrio crunogenus TaxID=39765 RepID=A0A4P7NX94_9GAMM|nr:DUF6339 family protein [Hydrogenovibrio crunogenus]QBZ82371.1 hypothetical protein GHNINEIG_00401 [Hydrogenovibrio crunogenus]
MAISMFKEKTFLSLYNSVPENLELYREGGFQESIPEDGLIPLSGVGEDLDSLEALSFDSSGADDFYLEEVKSAVIVFRALEELTLYLARDKRFWAFLTHTALLSYSRKRWLIPEDDEEAVKFVRKHFFGSNHRELERDNAASRLWWMAKLCSNVDGLSLEDSLVSLMYRADVRANLIERPTTALNMNVFSMVIKQLHESFKNDKALFERIRFRELMKSLNVEGGRRLLEVADENQLCSILDLGE